MKSVRFRSFFGPYSVRMRGNTNQKNSEYGYFSRSDSDVAYSNDIQNDIENKEGKNMLEKNISCGSYACSAIVKKQIH